MLAPGSRSSPPASRTEKVAEGENQQDPNHMNED